MSADRLREAARLLRKWADAALLETGGSWHASGESAYVVYVASLHPGVALALADWLDDLADYDPSPLMPTEAGAFKVADALLNPTEGEK